MTRLSPFLAWVAGLPEGALPSAARGVLSALAAYADGGREDPTHEDIGALSGHAPRSVERHIATLSRPETGAALVAVESVRTAEGWPRNRYRLLAPLTVVEAAETHRLAVSIARGGDVGSVAALAATRQSGEPAANLAGGPAANLDSQPPDWRVASRQNGEPAANLAGGQYREQAGARARPVLIHSSPFLREFDFGSDAIRDKAAAVLRVCGEGLAPLDAASAPGMLGSLSQLIGGEWAAFDFERDVLPVVSRKTGYRREKPLRDFWLLTGNIARWAETRAAKAGTEPRGRGRRRGRQGASRGVDAAAAADDPQRQRMARLKACRSIVAMIDSGQRPEWALDADERGVARVDAEAAFARARARYRAEVSALEADGNGGGDGGW